MGGLILLFGGMLIGANNPVKVRLVAEKIEDVSKEAIERGVAKSVDELKELRAKRGG